MAPGLAGLFKGVQASGLSAALLKEA